MKNIEEDKDSEIKQPAPVKLKHFVSFSWQTEKESGFGSCILDLDAPVCGQKDIDTILSLLNDNVKTVKESPITFSLLNYIPMFSEQSERQKDQLWSEIGTLVTSSKFTCYEEKLKHLKDHYNISIK